MSGAATEDAPPRRGFWNVPNTLTVARLAMTPAICGFIAAKAYLTALVVFTIAALTDGLDGYLARRLGQESPLGRQLDPLVDKVAVAAILVYLLPIQGTGLRPWMLAAILTRELIVQALRSLIEGRGEPFGARMAGKLKTALQCVSIGAILVVLGLGLGPAWAWVRDALTWAAVGLTIYSGCGYLALAWPKLRT